jgi:uncharacterized protein (DUF3820 family)
MDDNQKQLIKLAHTKMPFGKYEGWFGFMVFFLF